MLARSACWRATSIEARARGEGGLRFPGSHRDLPGEGFQINALRVELRLQNVTCALHRDQIPHPRPQLLERERLGEVVLGAVAEQPQLEVIVGSGGEQNDGDVLQLGVLPYFPDQLLSIQSRHHHIGDDQVGARLQGLSQTVAPVKRRLNPIVFRERLPEKTIHLGIVLNHQNQRLFRSDRGRIALRLNEQFLKHFHRRLGHRRG